MHTEALRFTEIRYNPESAAFEARVALHDNGTVYIYPVHLRAPLNADFNVLARGLADKAKRMHRMPHHRLGLRLRCAPSGLGENSTQAWAA